MYLSAWNSNSQGAKALAKKLGIKRIKPQRSRFVGGPNKLVVNWGCSQLPAEVNKCALLNSPARVTVATNKLHFFNCVGETDLSIPEWTESRVYAEDWLKESMVICRTILNGHSGAGIVLAKTKQEMVDAPLYVRYVPKKNEYRVHVGDCGKTIIDIQKKAKRVGIPKDQVNFQIRNHTNGFIYMRDGVADNVPKEVLTNAQQCVSILGLNFGAVDVIWNERQQRAYVLEVNTAPGLVGTTLQKYVDYFRQYKERENHR